MEDTASRAVAIVAAGAILPDAPNVPAFWNNVKTGRYSITEVGPDRWDSSLYYDSDHAAPDKTYSKIGGWVREAPWEPMKWKMPIPPRVADAMDGAQQWAIASTREALEDYGYPKRPFDPDRTAVILGNAMAGERHYRTSLRVFFPEYARELAATAGFAALPENVRREVLDELHSRMGHLLPEITEDSMPGELANCIAGRIANLFNFHGPNFVCDAACASAMAAINAAVEGLVEGDFDVAVTGGIDRNMGAPTFVKFCKIGALSATGTRPYAEGADGFVMGEGAAIFLLKRLADAERDGDKVYAVLRGMGGSSDGRGKGITAPNPIGQKFCVERAWKNAGLSPATVSYIEGHGTSTRVGDVVEVNSMANVLKSAGAAPKSVGLGSVKSNIGHLKGAAGAAGLLKTALALHHKELPPSLNFKRPNPDIDFAHSPLYVNAELRPWTVSNGTPRRAGLSAFGFGGTNFHAVLEEYIPGKLNGNGKHSVAVGDVPSQVATGRIPNVQGSVAVDAAAPIAEAGPVAQSSTAAETPIFKAPLRGALVIGADSVAALTERLRAVQQAAAAGNAPAPTAPAESDLRAAERLAIDFADAADLADKSGKALKALAANQAPIWKALRAQGIFRGQGAPGKIAFLYTGQGSQYVNMTAPLRAKEPIVAELFVEADRIMTPLLGKPLSEFVFVDPTNPDAVAKAEESLRQTEITQPTVLTIDLALTRLMAAYGIQPDMTMGHSLGEYGALVASGSLTFESALLAVSARGRGMTKVAVTDTGKMAAVFAPLAEVERLLKTVDGYVVIANVNSGTQSVIGGASTAVEQAIQIFLAAGYEVAPLPVSHAFHTTIVAPASEPLRDILSHLNLQSPKVPIVSNVNGEFYPTGPDVVPQMLDLLAQQVASPVLFVKGLNTLYDAGARVFVEVGPKKALQGFAEEVLGGRGDVVSLFTNHPKFGDIPSFNQALCGLYAAGLGRGIAATTQPVAVVTTPTVAATPPQVAPAVAATSVAKSVPVPEAAKPVPVAASPVTIAPPAPANTPAASVAVNSAVPMTRPAGKTNGGSNGQPPIEPVTITGAALGLPGTDHIFDDGNVARILRGDQFIGPVPERFRQSMLEKRITRLLKSDNGGPTFESIEDVADVIKLAGRGRAFDLEAEFGISGERVLALDRVTCLAIASGIDALRDAGIPLVMRYKTTTKGTQLPERWGLPDDLRDDTGVIMGSAFPGYDSYAEIMGKYYVDHARREELAMLEGWRAKAANGHSVLGTEMDRRIDELRAAIEKEPYVFDRRFLLRVLSMGHSQFAELIGARGPNTQINAACATTAQAVSLAEDWIRAGRCRRVVVISADDVTSDNMIGWFGPGFLASGAAATDEKVEDAAIPFDRRRHGLIMGMGAAALVVESAEAARERGIRPICEVLSAVTANSAFHGTRLDVQHIGLVMEKLVAQAEVIAPGVPRAQIAPQMVFVSHETYTPARGGSASAEVHALRHVFGDGADQIVVANTKGYTGHAMATGIEDVLAVKALETGLVPPVANFKEVDPELGPLNLSKGGSYPIEYALHLGAGFGSQISMMLLRWVPTKDRVHPRPDALGYTYRIADPNTWNAWLTRVAGKPVAALEVVKRTLRVPDPGFTARVTAAVQESRPVSAPTPVVRAIPAPTPTVQVAPPVPVLAAIIQATQLAPVAVSVAVPQPPPPPKPQPSIAVSTPVAKPKAVASAPPASPKSAVSGDPVKERILTLMVEKTGYPSDMLDPDLDLEADLGVDTVKQAEMFAAIREIYNIPRDENRKLRDYPTLAHVIAFVYENRPDLAGAKPAPLAAASATPFVPAPVEASAPVVTVAVATTQLPTDEEIKQTVLAIVAEKTGYPPEMLDLDLDLEADLGIDTVKQAEMFASVRAAYNIPRDENMKLRDFPTLAHVIQFAQQRRPGAATATVAATPAPAPVATTAPVIAPPAAPPVATAVPPVATAVATQSPTDEEIKQAVLAIVAEKTGYPPEMLDLDLDLEADLGIDTVKQAEMFASVRAAYNIPRDENMKLRDFPTLAHVIQFAQQRRPAAVTATAQAEPPAVAATPVATAPPPASIATPANVTTPVVAIAGPTDEEIKQKVLAIVAEKTGYPQEMLDLDLDLEADLGIDTVKQAEMFASVRAAYNIPRDENMKLRDFPTLAHVIQFAQQRRPGAVTATAQAEPPAVAATPVATTAPPAPIATPANVTTPVAIAGPTDEEIKQKVLAIVAEKTGYPQEMLDLDLDLEADLGVDTVKQAEMFASVRAAYNIPRDENMKLRDFPTLAHVIQFAQQRRPQAASAVVPAVAAPTPTIPAVTTPTTAQPTPSTANIVVVAPAPTEEEIKQKVLEIVAEKTGYPQEMLDLDLDLEADLGVDTVKQAEMFASVRAAYNIPRDENMKLRDFPTLAHVIQFAQQRRPGAAAAVPVGEPRSTPAGTPAAPRAPRQVPQDLLTFDAAERVPRRVPVPVLRPPIDLCKPTGVTLAVGSRVVIMPDTTGTAVELSQQLKAKGIEVLLINGTPDADALTATLKNWLAAGPIQGVYWLPALNTEDSLGAMTLSTWREALRVRVKLLYTTIRTLFEQVAAPGTFLVSATALGGQHGYDDFGASMPLGGAVTGFTKTYKRERNDVTVKAVDFEPGRAASEIAEALISETLRDPGTVEIGYNNGLRWSVGLQEKPVANGQPGMQFNEDTVFVVTGAAGSIVSAITADLAAASGGTFYLLDLVPEPDPNNADLKRFVTNKDGLKRDLFARIQARGERATPALVEKELAALERAQAAQAAIDAVRAAGGKVQYFSVNLTDVEAVAAIIEKVRTQSGRIDVLLHAAGIERSHFLPDKDPREFDLVFDVKSDGWFNLLHAIGDMPLGATVAFSSVAGRFGNGGQTDYSSANDLLCKITSSFRTTRPLTRGIVIDWSAWGGIGMATRGSIPKMMEMAGIDMLPPEAGVPWIRRELTAGGTSGEVVVGNRLGILLNEWDPTGGLDNEALNIAREAQGPMVGKITGMGVHSGLTMETTLNPSSQPFLYDHRIDGTPVLPGVMGIEAFAEAAVCVHPGWRVGAVEEVNFLAPFKFYRDEPRTLTVQAVFRPQGDAIVSECRLIGRRTLPNQPEPQETLHFTARVRLTKQPPEAITDAPVKVSQEAIINAAEIYHIYFHGPAYQVVERAWWDGKRMVGELTKGLPANHQPADRPTLMSPRLIELCFQTAGLWEMGTHNRMGLPLHVAQVGWLRSPQTAEGPLYAVVTPDEEGETFDAQVVDQAGNQYLHVDGYRTVALPNSVDLEPLRTMRAVTV